MNKHTGCHLASNKGFTLVEVLVAFIILGFMLAGALHTYMHSQATWRKIEEKDDVLNSLRIALDRMSREARLAITFKDECTEDLLSFKNSKGVWIQYSLANGTVYRKEGTASKVPLADNVTHLKFSYLPPGVKPSRCKVVRFEVFGGTARTEQIKMSTAVFIRLSAGDG